MSSSGTKFSRGFRRILAFFSQRKCIEQIELAFLRFGVEDYVFKVKLSIYIADSAIFFN